MPKKKPENQRQARRFVNDVRAFMAEYRLNQGQMARILGVVDNTVGTWLANKCLPTIKTGKKKLGVDTFVQRMKEYRKTHVAPGFKEQLSEPQLEMPIEVRHELGDALQIRGGGLSFDATISRAQSAEIMKLLASNL